MNYTPRIEAAIRYATKMHDGQSRIDTEKLPYISHLFSVAVIVSSYTQDEDAIIAALLHDSLEDTSATSSDIRERFGETVLAYVEAVTEHKIPNWTESKQGYIQQLSQAPALAVLVASADKMHNIASRLALATEAGTQIFDRWSHTPAEYHWYHTSVYRIAAPKLPPEASAAFKVLLDKEQSMFQLS